jgi:4-amino-4-deoxy-L-arabinose transferase-like glycosyltransferase
MPEWAGLVVVGLIATLVTLYRLGDPAIYWWDEARVALNSLEMMHSSNPLIVTFNGHADLWNSKPPLAVWLNAISMRLFGINEFAVRLPSALAAIATTLSVYRFTERTSDRRTAFLAALILLGIGGYIEVHVARTADYDSLLVLFTTLATFSLYFAFDSGRFYPSAGYGFLALLTKGTAGLMMAPGYLLYALIYRKDLRRAILPGLAVVGATILFLAAREISQGGYVRALFGEEVVRFSHPADHGDHRDLGFYLSQLLWPWQTSFFDRYWNAAYVISAFPWTWLAMLSLLRPSKAVIYLWCCVGAYILVISVAVTQHPWYIAPAYPLIAILSAVGIQRTVEVVRSEFLFPLAVGSAIICVGLNIWKVEREQLGVMLWRERGQPSLIRALPTSAVVRLTPDVVWRTPAVKDGKIVGTELYFGATEFYRRTRPPGSIQIECIAPPFIRDSGRAEATSCRPPDRHPNGPSILRLPDSQTVPSVTK